MNRLTKISRLSLGTAQIGIPYGVVNSAGEIPRASAFDMLDMAWKCGISTLDTARDYGVSEDRIGSWATKCGRDPFIVTKLPSLSDPDDADEVKRSFEASRSALCVSHIDGYLCHRASDLSHNAVRSTLECLQANEELGAFGVSVYTTDEIHTAFKTADISLIQIPVSLANSKLLQDDIVPALAERGCLVFARSVYLQGVLLAPPSRIPDWLSELRKPVQRLHELAETAGTSPAALCLGAVSAIKGVSSIVIGAENTRQIKQAATALYGSQPDQGAIEEARSLFAHISSDLTDPRRWPAS